MSNRLVAQSLALASVAAITSYYGHHIYSSIALPPGLKIATSDRVPGSFAHSFAVSTVNPHRHITINDSRSVIVSVPNSISQEQILARFLSGFFGGYAFAPERTALRLLGKQLVNLKGLDTVPVSTRIWTTNEVDEMQLPHLHSVLFGAFRIIDLQRSTSVDQWLETPTTRPSYVDVAFGADEGFISGVHRFSVSEVDASADVGGKRYVTITFDHTSCNPRENKPLGPDVLQTFHLWYAMLLFKEGVVNVLKAG